MHKCSRRASRLRTGLGAGVASGSPSAADKNIHKCPQAKSVYDGGRVGRRVCLTAVGRRETKTGEDERWLGKEEEIDARLREE